MKKNLVNFPQYSVDKEGNVYSNDRFLSNGRFLIGKKLKCSIDKNGYVRVRISVDNVKYTFKVHRLVAETFIPNVKNLEQVNHIDGNKQNNKVENLEWCNNSENQKHAILTGLKIISFGEKAYAFKRKVLAKNKINGSEIILVGSRDMLDHGFDPRLVSACLHKKRKSHRGYTFKEFVNV